MHSLTKLVGLALCSFSALAAGAAGQSIFSASGADATAIQSDVDAFRNLLGPLNPPAPGSVGSGRREINWDGVTDQESAPGQIAGDFFNTVSPRGAVSVAVAPATGFQVSADSSNPFTAPVEFGNLDASYTTAFATFSAERLFTALGGNVLDVEFRIPGSTTPAAVRGFGAVFTDVDETDSTTMEFFAGDVSLGVQPVAAFAGDGGQSFLAVDFADNKVTRVRITCGDAALQGGVLDVTQAGANDLVVMDDFIYGEPVPITVTFAGVLGALEQLKIDVQALGLANKIEKDLVKHLNQAIKQAEDAAEKEALGQANAAKKALKPAAVHLRNFEKELRTKDPVNAIEEATLRDFSERAAAIAVDIALLTNLEP